MIKNLWLDWKIDFWKLINGLWSKINFGSESLLKTVQNKFLVEFSEAKNMSNKSTILGAVKRFEETGSVNKRVYHRSPPILRYQQPWKLSPLPLLILPLYPFDELNCSLMFHTVPYKGWHTFWNYSIEGECRSWIKTRWPCGKS